MGVDRRFGESRAGARFHDRNRICAGLMLACPTAEPPAAPFSVTATPPLTRVSEMVNLMVPSGKMIVPLPESVPALQEAPDAYSVAR